MYKGEDTVLEHISKKKMNIEELAKLTGFNIDTLRRLIESLKAAGYVTTEASESLYLHPKGELVRYAKTDGFPEFSVYKKALAGASLSDLNTTEKAIGIRWAKVKGFVTIEGGKLVAAKEQEEVETSIKKLVEAFNQLQTSGKCEDEEIREEFFQRNLLDKEIARTVTISYTGKPFPSGLMEGFDVNIPAKNASIGKNHPITKITKKMKSIMTELGFQEMEGNLVESSFWNFDALFQPQDHPAREMADTFYLDKEMPLPSDKGLVERVKKSHEQGWKYKWDPKEASKAVLRTHTTCLSARYLASIKDKKPRKYFAIGRVFRNEATDYKHLAEFHQVEGIIAWENAKFTDLLGVLKEFYSKLGFEKIRFRPSFFPYTEPSLEIEVYFEKRKQWLELGGAGIFRPEVSIPLANVYPVLAWGLSLERPLMLLLELEDIRDFYRNDTDFLSKTILEI